MASKQVQIRRDTAGNLAASTPATAEVGYDTTNKRLIVGDGSTAGGIKHLNYLDHVNNTFIYSSAGGTANAITVTLSPALTSYATPTRIIFKATATNTTATTINVNGLGAKNLYKFTAGTLGAIVAGDVVNGGIYEAIYDGTQFQLLTIQNAGITSVSQGDLNTSSGIFSSATTAWSTLAGGAFGFFPQIRTTGSNTAASFGFSGKLSVTDIIAEDTSTMGLTSSYATRFGISSAGATIYAQQTYITSSPPYDLGDGEVGGFIFGLVNNTGEMVAHYSADAPPWAYNGPTDIRCTHKCPNTGKKFRRVREKRTLQEIMDGAEPIYIMEEITHEIKNADMDLLPHPFSGFDPSLSVVLLDPMDERIGRLIKAQNDGEDISEAIAKGYIKVDNDAIQRKGPKGVAVHRMTYKYGKKGL